MGVSKASASRAAPGRIGRREARRLVERATSCVLVSTTLPSHRDVLEGRGRTDTTETPCSTEELRAAFEEEPRAELTKRSDGVYNLHVGLRWGYLNYRFAVVDEPNRAAPGGVVLVGDVVDVAWTVTHTGRDRMEMAVLLDDGGFVQGTVPEALRETIRRGDRVSIAASGLVEGHYGDDPARGPRFMRPRVRVLR